jgi:hypothetical protein
MDYNPFKHPPRSPSIKARNQRITALLPLVSGLRHAASSAARAAAEPLQAAIRDLERLNDIEVQCRVADDKTGPTLWLTIVGILEKP